MSDAWTHRTFEHNTATATLVTSGLGIEKKVFQNVGLTITGINKLALTWDSEQHLELTINYQGSDLMSDHIFPIDARYQATADQKRPIHGGCSTNNLPLIVPIDMDE